MVEVGMKPLELEMSFAEPWRWTISKAPVEQLITITSTDQPWLPQLRKGQRVDLEFIHDEKHHHIQGRIESRRGKVLVIEGRYSAWDKED